MIKKLTSEQVEFAKAWIHDTLILAGIKDPSSSVRNQGETSIYDNSSNRAASEQIWDTILYRKLSNVNTYFNTLASQSFKLLSGGRVMHKSAEILAIYVAWFCSINGIYWNNSALTEYEMNEFTSTYLGQALKLYDCFTVSLLSSKKMTTTSTNGTHNKVTGIIPSGSAGSLKPHIKYNGSLLSFVRDLLSKSKEHPVPADNCMFRIDGVNANSKTVIPCVFIRPTVSIGKSGTTNKVFIGSANDYADFPAYFDSLTDANNFLQTCDTSKIIPSSITSVHVVKRRIDPNGYFKVNTEFGPVFITAKKLQESLIENTEEPIVEATKGQEFDSFVFTDNLMKEI